MPAEIPLIPKVTEPEPVSRAEELLGPPQTTSRTIVVSVLHVVFTAICGALAQALTDHATEIQAMLMTLVSSLPALLQGYAGALAGTVVAVVVSWLRARSVANTKQKVVDALASPRPPDLQKYYKK